jgi:carboxyl-terminal processing protease
LDPKHPYIRISTFQENTTKDLSEVLSRYESGTQPIEGMILDLRNNPGGLLNEAVKVSDLFLESGLIVYTQGRIKEQNLKFYAHKNKTPQPYSMVVLVNEGSASASEIVAGALQDHKRAIIMGAPTFGKGSVQTIIPLEDQSGLRLTTSLYYTPSGRSIQAKGIVPDIEMKEEKTSVKREVKEVRPLREKDLDRHLEDQNQPKEKQDGKKPEEKSAPKAKDSKENKDTKVSREQAIRTDPLVLRALDLLKGWEILNKRSKS